ncbi:MAG: D-alanyl-D-alanine carboxypeptidase [Butyricicoccus sp.]
MKKLFCVLALLLVLPRAGAVSARAAVVIDADTGETLFEQNADSRLPMASTTKIMTALVALGEGDLDRVYTVKPEYAAVEGSSMYLKAGETLCRIRCTDSCSRPATTRRSPSRESAAA